jgi:HAMP domain-containing protein
MQIRTLFFVCMSAVALMATSLGCWVVTEMVVEYRLAGRVQRAVGIDVLLFAAADRIGQERPVTGDALLGAAPADAALGKRLAIVRRAADEALLALDNEMRLAAAPGAKAQRAVVHHIQDNLAAWRADADEMLRHPKTERDPGAFSRNLAGFNDVFEATTVVLDMGDLAASQHDGTAVELMALARDVWEIRSALGLRTVPLMTAIDAGVSLAPDTLEEQARYAGATQASWTPIAALSRRLVAIPNLKDAILTAREAADAYEALCRDVIAAGRGSNRYPVAALELGRAMVRTAPVLLEIRDRALAAAQARVAETRQRDGTSVAIAGVVLAMTVVSMITAMMVLQRRIVWPVLALTDVIGRIARLEFDVAIPARTRMDEIGALAGALETLRRGAMAGEENRKQIVHLSRHDPLTGLAEPCRNGWRWRLPWRNAVRYRLCSVSIWIVSRQSTTASAIPWATCCYAPWLVGCWRASDPTTWRSGWAAMSSSFCWRASNGRNRRPRRHAKSLRRSASRSISTARSLLLAVALASRPFRRTPIARSIC